MHPGRFSASCLLAPSLLAGLAPALARRRDELPGRRGLGRRLPPRPAREVRCADLRRVPPRPGHRVGGGPGPGSFARTVTITVETWTYDLGSSRLAPVREASRPARSSNVRTGGYGHAPAGRRRGERGAPRPLRPHRPSGPATPPTTCSPSAASRSSGTSARSRSRWPRATGSGRPGAATVVVKETWTYDFGPRALVRFVHVRDGRVTGVRTGGYGYSE